MLDIRSALTVLFPDYGTTIGGRVHRPQSIYFPPYLRRSKGAPIHFSRLLRSMHCKRRTLNLPGNLSLRVWVSVQVCSSGGGSFPSPSSCTDSWEGILPGVMGNVGFAGRTSLSLSLSLLLSLPQSLSCIGSHAHARTNTACTHFAKLAHNFRLQSRWEETFC